MNTPPTQNQSCKPPPIPGRFAFEPMPRGASPPLVIEAQLKYPGRIIHELQNNWPAALLVWLLLLALLGMMAYGVIANRRLLGLLRKMSGNDKVARAVLFSWLAGNLFLGAQIAWTLRPFIGSPRLVIEFLRSDPLRGNFYEAVWRALRHLFF